MDEPSSSGAGEEFFDGAFSKAFSAPYQGGRSECMRHTADAGRAGFDMLLNRAWDGRVEVALVKPESPLAACYRNRAPKDVFPAPSSPGFWVPVGFRFTKP